MRKPPEGPLDGPTWESFFERSFFTGPTKESVWRRFAAEVGAEWRPGGVNAPACVQISHGRWLGTLDSPSGFNGSAFVRIRAPFVNPEGLRFDLVSPTILGVLRHWSYVDFVRPHKERNFGPLLVNQGTLPELTHLWFGSGMEPAITAARPSWIRCSAIDGYPSALRMLAMHVPGPALSPERLQAALALFLAFADGIDTLNGRQRDSVPSLIDDLLAPTVQVRDIGYPFLWDGARVCLRAARLLGAAGDSRAGPALLDVLRDDRVPIRVAALKALGEIGDPANLQEIIPFVGHRERREREVSEAAVDALRLIGYAKLARRLTAVIEECADPSPLDGDLRDPCVAALTKALRSPRTPEIVNAATALCVLGASGAMAEISAARRRLDPREETAAILLDTVIMRLSVAASLPRPARPPGPSPASLPRTAHHPEFDVADAPLPASPPDSDEDGAGDLAAVISDYPT